MLGLRSAFGGGGPGSNIAKQVAIIMGAWIIAKTIINNPPPADNHGASGLTFYNKPKLISH